MIVYNYDHNDIVNEEVICYYTKTNGNAISLYSVVELTIKHPEAKELAVVKTIDTRFIRAGNIQDMPKEHLLNSALINIEP